MPDEIYTLHIYWDDTIQAFTPRARPLRRELLHIRSIIWAVMRANSRWHKARAMICVWFDLFRAGLHAPTLSRGLIIRQRLSYLIHAIIFHYLLTTLLMMILHADFIRDIERHQRKATLGIPHDDDMARFRQSESRGKMLSPKAEWDIDKTGKFHGALFWYIAATASVTSLAALIYASLAPKLYAATAATLYLCHEKVRRRVRRRRHLRPAAAFQKRHYRIYFPLSLLLLSLFFITYSLSPSQSARSPLLADRPLPTGLSTFADDDISLACFAIPPLSPSPDDDDIIDSRSRCRW